MNANNDVTQIRIGRHMTGLIGLKAIFADVAKGRQNTSDATLTQRLLDLTAERNYIPEAARESYGTALLMAFKKHMGEPVDGNDAEQGLTIKVLGAGCAICDGIENDLMAVLEEMGLAANLEHVRDPADIARYKVLGTPAIVINEKVVAVGSAPPREQLKRWIHAHADTLPKEKKMEKKPFIKNIVFSEPHLLAGLVDYEEGRVVSRTFAQNANLSLTLFAFDAGEGVSTHTAPGDAMVQVLDGEALVDIDGRQMVMGAGQVVVMPANVPHAVTAQKRFKMLLTVVKG